ncbi:Thymidine kinase [Fructilactobacillus florum 2F]|nr:Thymidine kinase [Fructilactobacillus florum 2F]
MNIEKGDILAQLFFRYGAMNSGKSFEIIKVAHNYEEQGKLVFLMTSALDTRSTAGMIESRIGPKRRAYSLAPTADAYEIIANAQEQHHQRGSHLSCVLVDEAQFLTESQVKALARIVDQLDIPVMAFGLKNDFQNQLFSGSRALLLYADKLEEMKTICWFCENKAIMNLRVHDNRPVYVGEQVQVGGNESYYPVCRKHYQAPPLTINTLKGE